MNMNQMMKLYKRPSQNKILQNFPTSPAPAAPNAPPLLTGATPKVSPLLEPNESYTNFLVRLETAISHTVIREETKKQLEKLLAYENANQECQRAIAAIHETGTITDYLKACHNLGSETQKMQRQLKQWLLPLKREMKDALHVEIKTI